MVLLVCLMVLVVSGEWIDGYLVGRLVSWLLALVKLF